MAALRVSEALSLNLADVDLEEAVTVIRDTKFYKTQLVPLGSDVNGAMTQYANRQSMGRRQIVETLSLPPSLDSR